MFRTNNTKFSRSPETWPSCEVTLRFFYLLEKNEILSCMSDPCYNLTLNNTSCLFILRNHVTDQNKSPQEQCTKCTQKHTNTCLQCHTNTGATCYSILYIF